MIHETNIEAKRTAKRLQGIGEYYFSAKLREIELLNKEGKGIINLGIGNPDLPPHPDVIWQLHQESAQTTAHGYQGYKGTLDLRKAFAAWYRKWYHVDLDPETELLPLMGSKEGIMHICMTYLNEGDQVLVPNPGYPAYASAVKLAGGVPVFYALQEQQQWMPDFNALQQSDLSKVKLMFVNYPHMPTGKAASMELFEALVQFATQHQILLVHDNPYSFILNEEPLSILSVAGGKSVALELNSLSKSHNMAGWRIGMLAGDRVSIEEVLRFKSNMDSGMFLPLQLAAVRALSLDQNWYASMNAMYRARREAVYTMLSALGCSFDPAQTGMFVWARVPDGYADGYAFSDELLYHYGVFLTPGGIFGSEGNAYIRISLCKAVDQIDIARTRISPVAVLLS